jgi:hypothetical protein
MNLKRWQSASLNLFVMIALVLPLAGCIGGGGSSSSRSSDEDGLPRLSFFSEQQFVNAGQAVPVGVRLDTPATENISAPLIVVQLPEGSFNVQGSATIPAGAGETAFTVRALADAQPGDRVEIQFATGAGYRLGTPSMVVVRVPDEPLPLVSLVGGDTAVSTGAVFFFNVQRTECTDAVTVPLIRTGSLGCFSTPDAVSLAAGVCTQSLVGTAASGCTSGSLSLSILPPEGYAVPSLVTLESAGLSSSGTDASGAASVVVSIR